LSSEHDFHKFHPVFNPKSKAGIRVFLKNPAVIIFDEPTAALDPVSEKRIQQAIEQIRKHKTVLIIAHRLSTIKNVERILVLDNKTIVEQGTFPELMEKKGLFYTFYTTQFGKYATFEDKVEEEVKRALEHQRPLALGALYLKGFQALAEKQGNAKADSVLKKLFAEFAHELKELDVVAPDTKDKNLYYLLMPEKTPAQALATCNRLKKHLKERYPELTIPILFAVAGLKEAKTATGLINTTVKKIMASLKKHK
jgi:ABC-type multidrug transport system ATPase subunit